MYVVFVYSVEGGKSTQVTDGMSDAKYPVFDKDGAYLYCTASTDAGPSLEPDIHSFSRPVSRSIYLAVLSKEQLSPLAPESDEEGKADEKKPEDKKPDEKKPDDKSKQPEKATKIDFEN